MKKAAVLFLATFLVLFCIGSLYGNPKITKITKKKAIKSGSGYISQLHFTKDGGHLISVRRVYTGAGDVNFYDIWKAGTFKRIKSYKEKALPNTYKKLLQDAQYGVTIKNDDLIIQTTMPEAIVKKMKWSQLEEAPWSQAAGGIHGAMSPDKKYFILITQIQKPHGDLDMTQTMYVMDGKSFSLIKKFESSPESVSGVVFSPDGSLFAITGFYGVKIFNTRRLEFMNASVEGESIAFSNKGGYFATGKCGEYYQGSCSDAGVYVYEAAGAIKLLAKQLGKNLGITALTFSPDDKYLATATTGVDKDFNTVTTIVMWKLR